MADRILIVEDEDKLAGLLRDYLVQEGFEVTVLHRGDEVEEWMRTHGRGPRAARPHAARARAGSTCARRCAAYTDVSIIMVTARVDEIDRLLGLELGADDYICKPFSPREVVARVKAVLRRVKRGERAAGGGLTLDDAGYKAAIGGRDLGLTAVEFQLLKVLVAHPGRIYTREQLMDCDVPRRARRLRPHRRQPHQENPQEDRRRAARPRDRALGLRRRLQVRVVGALDRSSAFIILKLHGPRPAP